MKEKTNGWKRKKGKKGTSKLKFGKKCSIMKGKKEKKM